MIPELDELTNVKVQTQIVTIPNDSRKPYHLTFKGIDAARAIVLWK